MTDLRMCIGIGAKMREAVASFGNDVGWWDGIERKRHVLEQY